MIHYEGTYYMKQLKLKLTLSLLPSRALLFLRTTGMFVTVRLTHDVIFIFIVLGRQD